MGQYRRQYLDTGAGSGATTAVELHLGTIDGDATRVELDEAPPGLEGEFGAGFDDDLLSGLEVDLAAGFDQLGGADLDVLVLADGEVVVGLDLDLAIAVDGQVLLGLQFRVAVGLDGVVALVADAELLVVLESRSRTGRCSRPARKSGSSAMSFTTSATRRR